MKKETPSKVAEMREWYDQNRKYIENFKKADNALTRLRDVTKTSTKTVSAFSKESLRSYLRNIGSNERNLRNLSRYLYYRSQVYYRLNMYFANMFDMNARSIIPAFSLVEDNDPDAMLQSYNETLQIIDKMNLQFEMLKASVTCFREDVFYGCVYYDDTSLFILPLDPDSCKIDGIYQTGDFSFSVDMTYFRSHQDLLEYWGEPFDKMYREYEKTGVKFQPMPDEYAACFKARAEDWETVVPVFSGLLNALINLIDLEDIQAVADEQEIYKLIYLQLETLKNATTPDDWMIDPDIAIEYFNRADESGAFPDNTAAAIIPGELKTISFDTDKATDTTKIQNATKTVLNTSGGAQILNSATISGTTAFNAAIKADTEFAISMLLPQYQAWVNRFISYHVSNPAKVKFFEVSVYTKKELRDSMLESAQYGLPTKLAFNTLNGFSEMDTLALNFLEEQVLHLGDKFIPLSSSYTQSGKSGGGQTKDDDHLTDDGEASRDKRDRN